MSDADLKTEIMKAIIELQFLGHELNDALDTAAAEIEANKLRFWPEAVIRTCPRTFRGHSRSD